MQTLIQLYSKWVQTHKEEKQDITTTGSYNINTPEEVCFEGILVTTGSSDFIFQTEGIRVYVPKPEHLGSVTGASHLRCLGKEGLKVKVRGMTTQAKCSNKFIVEATSFEILEDPRVKRPVGLPISGRGTLLKLVSGDVVQTSKGDLKTLSVLEAKVINDNVAKGTATLLEGSIVSFVNRPYKEQGEIKVPSTGIGVGGEEYTEEDIRTGKYQFEINLDGNDLETWKPCIDTLYRDHLKNGMKQAQTKVDAAVKELAEFNKAYGEFVDYREYQSKMLLKK